MVSHVFSGDLQYVLATFDLVNKHLYTKFYNELARTIFSQWLHRYIHRYRRRIHSALLDGDIHETQYVDEELVNKRWISLKYDCNTFRPFSFIEDYVLPTAKPSHMRRRWGVMLDLQRYVCSGYQHENGQKAQLVYLTIGLIGWGFVTKTRQNGNGVKNISGLNKYLHRLLRGVHVGGLLPCLSGDLIFAVFACSVPSFRSPSNLVDRSSNTIMNMLRVVCEHVNGGHVTPFQLFQLTRYLRLYKEGARFGGCVSTRFFCRIVSIASETHSALIFDKIYQRWKIKYIPMAEVLVPSPAVDPGAAYWL